MHAGLTNAGGFPDRVAGFLGGKYGYDPADAGRYTRRVLELLGHFATVLRAQQSAGKDYYLGDTLSAVDVYSAAFMALFKPLPQEQCAMSATLRSALEWLNDETRAALDPLLLKHRDMMYTRHLETPLAL